MPTHEHSTPEFSLHLPSSSSSLPPTSIYHQLPLTSSSSDPAPGAVSGYPNNQMSQSQPLRNVETSTSQEHSVIHPPASMGVNFDNKPVKSELPSNIAAYSVPIQSDTRSSSSAPTENKEKLVDKQSFGYIVKSSIAGGIAGTSAKTLIAPLDRVKILFQTSNPEFKQFAGSWLGFYKAGKQIYRTQGFVGLFQGHSATLLRIFPYASTKFVAYEQVRSLLIPSADKETSVRRFMAGSISGVISVFVTYPLDLIRVRLAFQTKAQEPANIHQAFQKHKRHYDYKGGRFVQMVNVIFHETPVNKMYHSSPSHHSSAAASYSTLASSSTASSSLVRSFLGLTNFYRGFFPTIMGMIPYAGVSFWAHDFFHDIFRSPYLAPYAVMSAAPATSSVEATDGKKVAYNAHSQPLTNWAQLTAGGLAGMMAQTASYPLEVIRRRIQVSGVTGESIGLTKVVGSIYSQSGIRGFFVGLSVGYIKVVPMFACSFFVYERLKLVFGI